MNKKTHLLTKDIFYRKENRLRVRKSNKRKATIKPARRCPDKKKLSKRTK